MRITYGRIVVGALLWATSSVMAQTQTLPTPHSEPVAAVVQLLDASGYRYAKETAWIWSVPFIGHHLSSVSVWVMTNEAEVIVESVIARQDQIVRAPAVMRQLLIQNGAADGVVFLLDEHGNYVARSRWPVETLDPSSFRSAVQAIVAATDAAYGAIQAFVVDDASSPTVALAGTFALPSGATTPVTLLRGHRGHGDVSVSFNPAAWKETRSGEVGKRMFQSADGSAFALVIAEGIEMPSAQLRARALANMRQTASDLQVVQAQRRHVNGTDILSLQTNVTVQGVEFTCLGYYYAGSSGTVQVVTYTERAKFNDHHHAVEEFLNGFRVGR